MPLDPTAYSFDTLRFEDSLADTTPVELIPDHPSEPNFYKTYIWRIRGYASADVQISKYDGSTNTDLGPVIKGGSNIDIPGLSLECDEGDTIHINAVSTADVDLEIEYTYVRTRGKAQ